MKPQDVLFFLVFIGAMLLRKPKVSVLLGLLCLILAIPLFMTQTFFTAQRLVMYGAAFIFLGAIGLVLSKQ